MARPSCFTGQIQLLRARVLQALWFVLFSGLIQVGSNAFWATVRLGKAKVVHLQYRRINRSNHAYVRSTLRLLHGPIRFYVAINHQENEVPNLD